MFVLPFIFSSFNRKTTRNGNNSYFRLGMNHKRHSVHVYLIASNENEPKIIWLFGISFPLSNAQSEQILCFEMNNGKVVAVQKCTKWRNSNGNVATVITPKWLRWSLFGGKRTRCFTNLNQRHATYLLLNVRFTTINKIESKTCQRSRRGIHAKKFVWNAQLNLFVLQRTSTQFSKYINANSRTHEDTQNEQQRSIYICL